MTEAENQDLPEAEGEGDGEGDGYFVIFLVTGDRAYVHDPRDAAGVVEALIQAKKAKRVLEIGTEGEESAFDSQAVAGVAPAEAGAIDEVWRYQVQQERAEEIAQLKAEHQTLKDKIKARSR